MLHYYLYAIIGLYSISLTLEVLCFIISDKSIIGKQIEKSIEDVLPDTELSKTNRVIISISAYIVVILSILFTALSPKSFFFNIRNVHHILYGVLVLLWNGFAKFYNAIVFDIHEDEDK